MTKKFIVEIEDRADTRWTLTRVTVREETAVEKNLMFIGKMTAALEGIKEFKERYPEWAKETLELILKT